MAKKIITTTRQVDDDFEERQSHAQKELENDPAEAGYSEFVSKFRGAQGCRIRVHRLTPNGKRQYCFFGSPEDIESEETIRLFHAQQTYAAEEGTYYLSVEVNGEQRPPFVVHIAPQVATPGTLTGSSQSGGMADIVRLLQQQNDRLEQRLLQQEKTPITELIECVTKLDSMRQQTQPQQLPIEAIMKAVEIGKSLNPSAADDWNGLLISTLKDNAPTILAVLGQLFSRGKEALTASQQPQVPATDVPVPQPQQEPIPEEGEPMPIEKEEAAIMKQLIDFLKIKAMNQSDPGLYIDWVYDNKENPLYARLIRKIVNEDFSAFVALDPDIDQQPYRNYFRAIYNGLGRIFKPKNPVVTAVGRKSGDKGDTPANGASGKTGGKG